MTKTTRSSSTVQQRDAITIRDRDRNSDTLRCLNFDTPAIHLSCRSNTLPGRAAETIATAESRSRHILLGNGIFFATRLKLLRVGAKLVSRRQCIHGHAPLDSP